MPCQIEMRGEIAAIRVEAQLREPVSPNGTIGAILSPADRSLLLTALSGAVYVPHRPPDWSADQPTEPPETVGPALENLKRDLTDDAHEAFKSNAIEVREVRFAGRSFEILVILGTVGAAVAEIGAIMAGLREMARLVPEPLRRFVSARAQRVLGRSVVMQMQTDPPRGAIEIRDGMLAGSVRDADADQGVSPALNATPAPVQPEATLPRGDEIRVTTYLMISHAVLLLAIIAAVLMLVIDGL